ncbi:uncharacterized protein LOC123540253 isoform X2 [Mercenaria mercenaria]|uniref:uncharacterized protein LOC123540253 isoform X2 n=1 Tax=Mercenaria mercenaria TaxID=6596 RepID=UPI00234F32CA|nr:uncharacterized protein LOC123540253 isoform X2 [Mercenaria mercenaria]
MGNNQCVPHAQGEPVKDLLRRKFSCVSRQRKVDDLLRLAVHGDEKQFKKTAGAERLTERELDEFYEGTDALTNEFDDDVIEIEMYNYGHETPSEYSELDSDEYETDYSEHSYRFTPVTPKFTDPVMQMMYEEYCQRKWDKELDLISLSDLPELEEYKTIPVQKKYTTDQIIDRSNNKEEEPGTEDHDVHVQPANTMNKKMNIKSSDKGSGEYPSACNKSRDQVVNGSGIVRVNETQMFQELKRRSGLPERITEGLRQKSRDNDRANNIKSKLSNSEPGKRNSEFSMKKQPCVEAASDIRNKVHIKEKGSKQGLLERIAETFRRMTSSAKPSNIINVKPASPETTFVNCVAERKNNTVQ